MKKWFLLFLILAPHLAIFALAWSKPENSVMSDSIGYLNLANNLWRERVFSSSVSAPFEADTFRTPGYVLFLLPFTILKDLPLHHTVLIGQVALSLLGILVFWRWNVDFNGPAIAAVMALVYAWDWIMLFHVPLILSETLFLFVLVLSLWTLTCAIRQPSLRKVAMTSLAWSAAIMIKPIALYLPVFLSFFWIRQRSRAILFLLVTYSLPGLWILRNYQNTGTPIFSSVGGISLLRYPAANALALDQHRSWGETVRELEEDIQNHYPGGFRSPTEKARVYGDHAIAIMRRHPWRTLEHCLYGTLRILCGTGIEMLFNYGSTSISETQAHATTSALSGQGTLNLLRRRPLAIVPFSFYVLYLSALYIAFVYGLFSLWRRRNFSMLMLLLGGALYFLVLSNHQGYYRYRLPMMPFLVAGAGFGIVAWRGRYRRVKT